MQTVIQYLLKNALTPAMNNTPRNRQTQKGGNPFGSAFPKGISARPARIEAPITRCSP
jgi:hypothetical protein